MCRVAALGRVQSVRLLESSHSASFHMTGVAPTGSNRIYGSLL